MPRFISKWVLVGVLALPSLAAAQDVSTEAPIVTRGQGWSAHSGQTVGDGVNVVTGQIGWPGISASFLHGATNRLDVGVRLTPLNYGFEGRIRNVFLGLKLQGVVRLGLLETNRFNLGLEFAPGPIFYFPPRFRGSGIGLALPLSVNAGIPVGSAIMVNFGMSMPMFVVFGTGTYSGFYIPILFGGGVEYFIDRRLAVTFNLKMGPSIHSSGNAEFAMDALIGVAYKF